MRRLPAVETRQLTKQVWAAMQVTDRSVSADAVTVPAAHTLSYHSYVQTLRTGLQVDALHQAASNKKRADPDCLLACICRMQNELRFLLGAQSCLLLITGAHSHLHAPNLYLRFCDPKGHSLR